MFIIIIIITITIIILIIIRVFVAIILIIWRPLGPRRREILRSTLDPRPSSLKLSTVDYGIKYNLQLYQIALVGFDFR